jgi:hypothetical protein
VLTGRGPIPASRTLDVTVRIAPDANLNWPIAVQVLILADETVVDELQALSAREWFDRRHTYFRDKRPDTQTCVEPGTVDIVEEPDRCFWEWSPGSRSPIRSS